MKPMNKLLVIADDLTGALDTGVQFSKKGIMALVLTAVQLSSGGMSGSALTAEVLVVDTESRHLPANKARGIVSDLVTDALARGFRYFYKKTDSALRGNIGAELTGLLDAGGACGNCLTFVPAFPKSRRVTRDGVHYIDGVEVGQSVFSKDPFTPVTLSSVTGIIRLQSDVLTENIARDAYEKAALRPEKKILRVLDAESVEDLEAIGGQLKRGGNLNLLAGCAGFAEILPELLDLPARELEWKNGANNILVVSGSVNPITLEQLSYGEQIGFSAFTLSAEQKLDASYPKSTACGEFVGRVANELKRSGRVIVRAVKDTDEVALENAAEGEISRRVADNIGEIALRIMSAVDVGNLVVFGGDTLHGVLSKMGCGGVVPVAEIEPGVVGAKILSKRHGCVIITKSGGLGSEYCIRNIEEFVFKTKSRGDVMAEEYRLERKDSGEAVNVGNQAYKCTK